MGELAVVFYIEEQLDIVCSTLDKISFLDIICS